MQKRSLFAVHLEQSNAHADALREKPFRPRDRLFERCRLSFKGPDSILGAGRAGEDG
jgi:hypothetical protein